MPRKPHPATIHDEFSGLQISRQQKYQLRLVRDGRCCQCGKKAVLGRQRCRKCLKSDLARHTRATV